MNFFTKMTLGAVGVLLAAVAAVLLFRSRDAAHVEALIRDAVGWVAQGDAERVAGLVDQDFKDGAYDAASAREAIQRHVRPNAYRKLEPTSIDVKINGDQARVGFTVRSEVPNAPPPLDPVIEQLAVVWLRKRDGQWKVVGFDWLHSRRR